MQIHPHAIVHPKAQLADDVQVGPFCVIGEHVTIKGGTRMLSHVTVEGWTEIGERCELHPFVSTGGPPQHLGYKGEPTKVVIGDDNLFREFVTVNRATAQGGGVTSIGNKNFLMAYVHVAHDCRLGSHLIMANAASLAGHITFGDHAIIGGLSGIHQYVRLGAYSMVGGCCALGQDLPASLEPALITGAVPSPIHLSMASLSNLQTLPMRMAGTLPWTAYLQMVISWSLRYLAISLVVMIWGIRLGLRFMGNLVML